MGRILVAAVAVATLFINGCGSGGGGGSAGPQAGPTPPPPDPQTLAGKDLHFVSIMAMPRNQSGSLTIHAIIRYRDTEGASANGIGYQLRRENGAVLTQGIIARLEPGESRQLMLEVDGLVDRERLIMAVDPANAVAETYENNNTVTVTAVFGETPPPASDIDLLFSDSHYHGAYYYRDPRLHFFIVNPNELGVGAANVKVVVQVNGRESWSRVYPTVPAATPTQLAEDSYEGREVTLTTSEVFGVPSVPLGRYVLTITIDPDNTIVEQNEANNYRRLIVEVDASQQVSIEPTAIPDIQLEDPHFHQFARYSLFHFWISNIHGGSESQTVAWRIVDEDGVVARNGTAFGTAVVGPQQLHEVVIDVPKDGDAELRYRLEFDPDNTVHERDESNNVVPFIIDWTPESSG